MRIRVLRGGWLLLAIAAGNATAGDFPPLANFIDQQIQNQWISAGASPAALADDAEFARRASLDLTGRIPSPELIRGFLADTAPDRRAALINRLLEAPEFNDHWAQWFADLTAQSHNLYRGYAGRNAAYNWTRNTLAQRTSLRDMVVSMLTATGNNYDDATGATNFFLVNPPAGPPQDNFDLLFVRSATAFLGMSTYDCLLCHSGRRHLEGVNLWASRASRLEAWQMSAFFSRYRFKRVAAVDEFHFDSNFVSDDLAGSYRLDTEIGNRPPRRPVGSISEVQPVYRDGSEPATGNWRAEFAEKLVADRMFSRNMANRLWKQVMGRGLVEPVDNLDPDRLDPANPPPQPWKLQASHPELLEMLAVKLEELQFDLRAFLRFLMESSTYQLSSRAPDKDAPEELYLSHRSRRLNAEDVHDAVLTATGVPATYRLRTTFTFVNPPVHWAGQLPGSVAAEETDEVTREFFMAFFPGDRNLLPRSSQASIMQQLDLLNSPFVTERVRVSASPRLREVAAMANNEDAVNQLFLLFLSRFPSEKERALSIAFLANAKNDQERAAAIEDLAWVCLNRIEFLMNH